MIEKMSLKKTLLKAVQFHKFLSMDDVESICRRENKKISNGERRLRELKEDGVYPMFHGKGYIYGYKFIEYACDTSGQRMFI